MNTDIQGVKSKYAHLSSVLGIAVALVSYQSWVKRDKIMNNICKIVVLWDSYKINVILKGNVL